MTQVVFNVIFLHQDETRLNSLLFNPSEQMSPPARQCWLTEKNVRDLSIKHFPTDCAALQRCKESFIGYFLSVEFLGPV